MKELQPGPGKFLICMACILLLTNSALAVFTMDDTCKFAIDGTYVADPDSCIRYGVCKDGKLNHKENCPDGFFYNTRMGECYRGTEEDCLPTVKSICRNATTPQTIADPNDCSNYCTCKGDGTYECSQCPNNQYYDPELAKCVPSELHYCRADSICRLVRNRYFLGDPNRCGHYVQCWKSVETLNSCRPGEFYHPQEGRCQSVNVCESTSQQVGPGVLEPLPTRPEMCELWHIPRFPYKHTDRTTCIGYYLCNDVTGPGIWIKCPFGTHFDASKEECVTPNAAACVYDRCANMDQAFVNAFGTKCASYLYCKNQTNQNNGGGWCSSVDKRFPYFNEVLGGCTDKLPEFRLCW